MGGRRCRADGRRPAAGGAAQSGRAGIRSEGIGRDLEEGEGAQTQRMGKTAAAAPETASDST